MGTMPIAVREASIGRRLISGLAVVFALGVVGSGCKSAKHARVSSFVPPVLPAGFVPQTGAVKVLYSIPTYNDNDPNSKSCKLQRKPTRTSTPTSSSSNSPNHRRHLSTRALAPRLTH